MTIGEIISEIELKFPLSTQESYDNCGLIYGDPTKTVTNVLVCLDVNQEVLLEAEKKKCELIISHHPLIFKSFKQFNAADKSQQLLINCIKKDISIYALHTNLDNSAQGVNLKIANKLGIQNPSILSGKENSLKKLVVFIPNNIDQINTLDKALFREGAGKIGNYNECHFRTEGTGTFKPLNNANPTIGRKNHREQVQECRIEYLISSHIQKSCLQAMFESHPYEEVAHEIYPVENVNPYEGSGMIGDLGKPMVLKDFITHIKSSFKCKMIRHTAIDLNMEVSRVAWCGGSGSFLTKDAIKNGANIFISSDFKYHDFFESSDSFVIVDIGHYESEQFTIDLIADFLKEKFTKFAIHLTQINTNPINYI